MLTFEVSSKRSLELVRRALNETTHWGGEGGGVHTRGCYCMFSSPLYFVTDLQFVSSATPPANSLLSHSAPLVPFCCKRH